MNRFALFLFLTGLLTAQAAQEVEITAEPRHHLVLANDQVRVFNVEIPPHAETLMHRHRHDYLYVTLGQSQVENLVKGKAPVTLEMHDGQTGFLPGYFAHVARNLSGEPYRNVTIEILQDDKLRESATHRNGSHPDENRGLNILSGGTEQILFVKDNIRASEFELQPRAAIPARPHSGPLLLIAIHDLDLVMNDARTGCPEAEPTPRHFNSGDSIWLPRGFARPVVNEGNAVAKFVTLEFR